MGVKLECEHKPNEICPSCYVLSCAASIPVFHSVAELGSSCPFTKQTVFTMSLVGQIYCKYHSHTIHICISHRVFYRYRTSFAWLPGSCKTTPSLSAHRIAHSHSARTPLVFPSRVKREERKRARPSTFPVWERWGDASDCGNAACASNNSHTPGLSPVVMKTSYLGAEDLKQLLKNKSPSMVSRREYARFKRDKPVTTSNCCIFIH